MPLSRRWTFILLWALAGLLPLAAAAPDAPVELSQQKITADTRKEFELLGYKFDDKADHILRPDSQPLTEGQLADLVSPYDFHQQPVTDQERMQLLLAPCRFDEPSAHILCLDSKTQAKTPLPKLGMAYMRFQVRVQTGHSLLERLDLLLSGQPADKPVSPEVAAKAKAMLAEGPTDALSPTLVSALNAPGAKAGDLRSQVDKAYTDSTRFFDGQTKLYDRFKEALPVIPGYNERKTPPQFFDDNERKLGQALRESAQAHFAQNPLGQELLAHFKDKDGKISLPPFLLLNIDPRYGAAYNPSNKTIVVNQQYVVDGITKDPALRKQLADPQKFAAYMLAHPEAREAFFKQHDIDLYHELTHAWQDRRDPLLSDMNRGDTPGVIHVEYEHEAFLQEMRYFHWKLLNDPNSVKDNPWLSNYMGLLSNFDQWRDGITQQYYQLWPRESATLPTAEGLQQERISTARRLMGESLYQAASEGLKLLGLYRGEQDLTQVQDQSEKRMDQFKKGEYLTMRAQGIPAVAKLYLANAQSAKVPIERTSDLQVAMSYAQASGDKGLIAQVKKAQEAKK
jgi:hypothetical protein